MRRSSISNTSLRYRDAHIPGAWLAIRANLAANLRADSAGQAARIDVGRRHRRPTRRAEVAQCTHVPVKVLHGGTAAWRSAGLPLENGMTRLTDTTEDVW